METIISVAFLLITIIRSQDAADFPPTEPVIFCNFSSVEKDTHCITNGKEHEMELQGAAQITSEGLNCNNGFAETGSFFLSPSVFGGFGPRSHSIETKVKFRTLNQPRVSPMSLYIASPSDDNIITYFDAITLFDKKYIVGSEHFNRSKIPMTGDGVVDETLVNQWIHLVITYDTNADKITMYRNGVQYGDSFSREFMPFADIMGVTVCGTYLQGVVAVAAVYDQVLNASTIEAHYEHYAHSTVDKQHENAENDLSFVWILIIFVFLGFIIGILAVYKCNRRKVHDAKPATEPVQNNPSEIIHLKEGIKVNFSDDVVKEYDNGRTDAISSPPEAFALLKKAFPPQEETGSDRQNSCDSEAEVMTVDIENVTEEKVEEIADEKRNNEDIGARDVMSAIGNMISLIKVDRSIISPSETTPQTAKTLSYPTPQTAKSIDITQENEAVILDEDVENV